MTSTRLTRMALTLALAIAAAGVPGASGAALAADSDPDLHIEYLGTGSATEFVRFEVKNLRRIKTPATTVTVETLPPYPPNMQTFQVAALNTRGDAATLTYVLDGACNGHRVRATVNLKDDDIGNNRVEAEPCDKMVPTPGPVGKPGSTRGDQVTDVVTARGLGSGNDAVVNVVTDRARDTGGIVTPGPVQKPALNPSDQVTDVVTDTGTRIANDTVVGTATDRARDTGAIVIAGPSDEITDRVNQTGLALVPEYLRPGKHTLPPGLSVPVAGKNQEVAGPRWVREPVITCRDNELAGPARPSSVGFRNFDTHDDDCTWHQYFQLAFRFDFSELRDVSFVPIEATLRFTEAVYEELDPNGEWVPFAGVQKTCRLRLASPNGSWDAPNVRNLGISYGSAHDQSGIGVFTQIDDLIVPMIRNADFEKDGLILIGASEEMNNDRAACMSQISYIELTFTYVIADR